MTAAELYAMLAKIELHAPVTIADCNELYNAIKPRLAAAVSLDVTITKDGRMMVVVGASGPKPYSHTLDVIA